MNTIDLLLKRRSIRKFKEKEVPWDNIVSMLYCALNAPMAGNIINIKFIVVKDDGNKKAIADACFNQAWIAKAPTIIAVVAEPEHQKRYYGVRGEKLYTIQNAAACTMSMIIAAESLGLGTCWVGSFEEEKLRGVLGLPEYVNVHVILPLGFPDETPKRPPKQWIRTITFHERYWGGRKLPGYGFYSENVQKLSKQAVKEVQKVAEKAGTHVEESLKKIKQKIINNQSSAPDHQAKPHSDVMTKLKEKILKRK
jgi:nitroreductase